MSIVSSEDESLVYSEDENYAPRPVRRGSVGTVNNSSDIPRRHSVFYSKDGLVFLVDNVLYKIPRDPLTRESLVFRDLFGLPNSHGEGLSDDQPIHLEQVSALDFQRLIAYLYPRNVEYETVTTGWNVKEWQSILHLATKYLMQTIRVKAIGRLSQLNDWASPIDKIKCGREYNYPPWVREGMFELVRRQSPCITKEEGEYLGLLDSLRCCAAREMCKINSGHGTPSYQHFDSTIFGGSGSRSYQWHNIDSILDAVFQDDIPKQGEGNYSNTGWRERLCKESIAKE